MARLPRGFFGIEFFPEIGMMTFFSFAAEEFSFEDGGLGQFGPDEFGLLVGGFAFTE